MAKTFRALSALLSYPTGDLLAAIPDIRAVIAAERLLTGRHAAAVDRFAASFAAHDLYDLEERYTLLFDRSRSLSLHLFEHIHGESRDRGQAMIDLADHYHRHGFSIAVSELPDHLPLFLEFLSLRPADEAVALLGEPAHVIAALAERLDKRSSPYAALFHALLALAKAKVDPARIAALATPEGAEADDLAALDRQWEEAAVEFGPGDPRLADDGCATSRMLERLRAATGGDDPAMRRH